MAKQKIKSGTDTKKSYLNLLLTLLIFLIVTFPYLSARFKKSPPKSLSSIRADLNAKDQQANATPSPSLLPSTYYENTNFNLSFSVPERIYTIYEGGPDNFGVEWVLVRNIKIRSSDKDGGFGYEFDLINTRDDRYFAWEGAPTWYPGSLEKSDSLTTMTTLLESYGIKVLHIEQVYLPKIDKTAYIVYSKNCYGGCNIMRMYLIPYEKYLQQKIYHTLTFTTFIADLGDEESGIKQALDKYQSQNFSYNSFDEESQKIIKIQDNIAQSLTIR